MSQDVFTLGDIHAPKLCDVSLQFINRLGCIFLFDDVLDLLALLAECSLKSVEMLVSDLFEDLVIIGKSDDLDGLYWGLRIFLRIWLDDGCVYSDAASLNSKNLIQETLVSLINTEWCDQVDVSVN